LLGHIKVPLLKEAFARLRKTVSPLISFRGNLTNYSSPARSAASPASRSLTT